MRDKAHLYSLWKDFLAKSRILSWFFYTNFFKSFFLFICEVVFIQFHSIFSDTTLPLVLYLCLILILNISSIIRVKLIRMGPYCASIYAFFSIICTLVQFSKNSIHTGIEVKLIKNFVSLITSTIGSLVL